MAVEARYSLVFVAANTFFGVLTQEDQVRCFENVEDRLLEGGVFALEAFVSDPGRFQPGRLSVSSVELDLVARLAGLSLRERWGGWRQEPFTRASPQHVSV